MIGVSHDSVANVRLSCTTNKREREHKIGQLQGRKRQQSKEGFYCKDREK
jgi:hypothetical protein